MKTAETSTLTRKQVMELAETSSGRVMLHLIAMRIDGRFEWHAEGIIRELQELEFRHVQGLN